MAESALGTLNPKSSQGAVSQGVAKDHISKTRFESSRLLFFIYNPGYSPAMAGASVVGEGTSNVMAVPGIFGSSIILNRGTSLYPQKKM